MRRSAPVQCRSRTPVTKTHIRQDDIGGYAISTFTATPACNFVRARWRIDGSRRSRSRNPTDCTNVRAFLFFLFVSVFHLLARFLSPSLPFFHHYSFSLPPKKGELFYSRNNFQFGRKLRIVLSLLRSHECIAHRITADAIRNCHGEFAASLALNMRRRAAVTSQSELQTKRVSAFQPNIRDVYFPEAVSHSAVYDVGCWFKKYNRTVLYPRGIYYIYYYKLRTQKAISYLFEFVLH